MNKNNIMPQFREKSRSDRSDLTGGGGGNTTHTPPSHGAQRLSRELLDLIHEPQMIAEWPDLLPGYDWRPAARAGKAGRLLAPPVGIVIHSGDKGAGTAEWAWKPEAGCWAHFAWSSTLGRYVQTERMDRRAYHAPPYNGCSLGIEMPGPAAANPRPPEQREAVRHLVAEMMAAIPSLRWITGHQWITHDRQDPGPGVTGDWFDGLGLEVHWRWVGGGLL